MSARRGENPETPLTKSIRGILDLMRVAHFKHWSGPFSERGVPDLVGTIPGKPLNFGTIHNARSAIELAQEMSGVGSREDPLTEEEALVILAGEVRRLQTHGRSFWCEVKIPGKNPTEEQQAFLDKMRAAGAVAFVARSPHEVINALTAAGFKPAERIKMQFPGRPPDG